MSSFSTMISRRTVVAGLSLAGVIGQPSFAAAAATDADDQRLLEVWRLRHRLLSQKRELTEVLRRAESQLPWWAAPGPMFLTSSGAFAGGVVDWPALRNPKPPEDPSGCRLIRVNEFALRRAYERDVASLGETEATAVYEDRLYDLEARKNEQQAEKAKLRIPQLSKLVDQATQGIRQIRREIEELPTKGTANYVVVAVLLNLCDFARAEERISAPATNTIPMACTVLRAIYSQASNDPARDATDFLNSPTKPIGAMNWYEESYSFVKDVSVVS
jgi:hypothetical protein